MSLPALSKHLSSSLFDALFVFVVSTSLIFPATVCARSAPIERQERFLEAAHLSQQGAFDRAIAIWREVAEATQDSDPYLSVRSYLGVASACHKMGLYQEALQALTKARPLFTKLNDVSLAAQYDHMSGNIYVAMHKHAEALRFFVTAADRAASLKRQELRAAILNDYGSALSLSGYATDAISAYQQSLSLARELNLKPLVASTALNMARLYAEREEIDSAATALRDAEEALKEVGPSFEWAVALLAAVDLDRRLEQPDETIEKSEVVGKRKELLARVENFAASVANSRLLSLTYSAYAQDARALGDHAAAESLLRKAVFHSAQAQAGDVLYQAYWHLAQVLRDQDKLALSLDTFERALATLAPIRDELLNGHHDSHRFFQREIRPVYAEYIDALFVSADALADSNAKRPVLERARTVIESMTGAELQDYFRDECVIAQERRATTPEHLTQGVAVLYPVVLADRIELLLIVNGEILRGSVSIEQARVVETAVRLRELLQDASNRRFMPYANRMYRWLIEPIKSQLISHGVDTLVVVPDGVLRSVPFAALHSGDRYLIEELAVAVTPALKFTALPRAQPSEVKVLVTGMAQSAQGFAPLPKVTEELTSIHDYFAGRVIANHEYTKANLRAALAADNYAIVHMATHSTVGSTPSESFLLTYDGKLTMEDLESLVRINEFRDRSVELLTLSACETAVGDDRAALGLAGMAVKSGAASVVASLWLVDDNATAELMTRFYAHMQNEMGRRLPKAKALRAAQLNLLSQPSTEHPANWAAFMLIGNWQ